MTLVQQPLAVPSMVFTLVAYREDGVNTCRGQVMDRSSSEHSISVASSPEGIAEAWAQLKFDEPEGREYCSTEFTLLVNGFTEDAEGDLDEATQDHYLAARTLVTQLMEAHLAKLYVARQEADDREEVKRQAAAEETRRRHAAFLEARELAELARLQAKHGIAKQ